MTLRRPKEVLDGRTVVTEVEKVEIWDRRSRGQSLSTIARHLDRGLEAAAPDARCQLVSLEVGDMVSREAQALGDGAADDPATDHDDP